LGVLDRGPSSSKVAPITSATLIIATWRRASLLRDALAGVRHQTRQFDQVLVAVRPEDEAARDVLAVTTGLPVEEVLVHRPGAVAARNAAMDVAKGDVIAYLDDDAVPPADWLERILRHFEADARVGAVGGRDRIHHGDEVLVGQRRKVATVTAFGRFIGLHHLGTGPVRDVYLLKGVNMSIRREWLPRLRFDENLRGRGAEPHEDWALALAVRRAGFRVIYDPAIWVDHYEGERIDVDARFNPTRRTIFDRAHNQTYAGVRYLPLPRALAHTLYALSVGTSNEPGIIAFLYRLLRGHQPALLVQELLHSLTGRITGIRTAVRFRCAATHVRPPSCSGEM
jgi:GT2 family glycosyltransferase